MVIIFKLMAIKMVVNEEEDFTTINFPLRFIRVFKLLVSF